MAKERNEGMQKNRNTIWKYKCKEKERGGINKKRSKIKKRREIIKHKKGKKKNGQLTKSQKNEKQKRKKWIKAVNKYTKRCTNERKIRYPFFPPLVSFAPNSNETWTNHFFFFLCETPFSSNHCSLDYV